MVMVTVWHGQQFFSVPLFRIFTAIFASRLVDQYAKHGAICFLVNLCTQLSPRLVKINVGAIFVSINGPSLTRPRLSSTTPQHIGGTNTPQHCGFGLLQDAKSSNASNFFIANFSSCSRHPLRFQRSGWLLRPGSGRTVKLGL